MENDFLLPFYIQKTAIRGRFVKLDQSLNQAFAQHHYPNVVKRYLMELTAVALLTTYCFKFQGKFTLQVTSEGPIRLMVVDVETDGTFRLCARYDQDKLKDFETIDTLPPLLHLFGPGYLTFTIDPSESLKESAERYQGVVALEGENFSECMQHFFRQSEQLETGIVVASSLEKGVSGIMIQKMPGDDQYDLWVDYMMFLGTISPTEMLTVNPKELVHKLFWEQGIVFDQMQSIKFQCSCSVEKVRTMLATFSEEARKNMLTKNKEIEVTCEFCQTLYTFKEEEVR